MSRCLLYIDNNNNRWCDPEFVVVISSPAPAARRPGPSTPKLSVVSQGEISPGIYSSLFSSLSCISSLTNRFCSDWCRKWRQHCWKWKFKLRTNFSSQAAAVRRQSSGRLPAHIGGGEESAAGYSYLIIRPCLISFVRLLTLYFFEGASGLATAFSIPAATRFWPSSRAQDFSLWAARGSLFLVYLTEKKKKADNFILA